MCNGQLLVVDTKSKSMDVYNNDSFIKTIHDVWIGKNGCCIKEDMHEGDMKTPLGDFYLGVSFGLSSLYELLRVRDEFKSSSNIELYVISMNTFNDSFKITNKIRSMGINTLLELEDKKLKKCLDYANKENIKYVIIIGEDEIKNNKISLKNMETSENTEISLDNLDKIKELVK